MVVKDEVGMNVSVMQENLARGLGVVGEPSAAGPPSRCWPTSCSRPRTPVSS